MDGALDGAPAHPHRPAVCLRLRPDGGPVADWAELTAVAGLTPSQALIVRSGPRKATLRPSARPVFPAAARSLGAWLTLRPCGDGELRASAAVPAGLAGVVSLAGPSAPEPDPVPRARPSPSPLVERLAAGQPFDPERARLLEDALRVALRPGFDTLISLPRLRFEPFVHQLRAASVVLRRMRGRAILADEVGLGKTIEAGLVLSELYARGLARRVLILVPAGLVGQWAEELRSKFGLSCAVLGGGASGGAAWDPDAGEGIALASLAVARRAPHRGVVSARPWDLVVVDEAHRCKNPASASAGLVKGLRARYLLLLTATPVENRLDDLFHLVALVRPGHLGTLPEFRRRYGGAAGPCDPVGLQGRMREVLVRHRRGEVALMLPRRLAETRLVSPDPEEGEVYAAVSAEVRRRARAATPDQTLALRHIQRMAGSHPRALAAALRAADWTELAQRAAALGVPAKSRALLAALERHLARQEKVVVFTGFRRTAGALREACQAQGIPVAAYHGSLGRREKDAAIADFQTRAAVLVATEAAGEGRNLQFCHAMVNYDLPWNPMQIEQRLGRIHRIGQEHDVLLANLVQAGTVEERILRVLETKIHLFELVVGELDMILGRVDEGEVDFESLVFSAHAQSRDDADFDARMEALGERLVGARAAHLESRERNDALVAREETG